MAVSLRKALILAVLISYMQTPMSGEGKKKFFSEEASGPQVHCPKDHH
jgi:hypothetical protein